MSVNFHDTSGVMAGVDIHKYVMIPPPIGLPIPVHPTISAVPFIWPLCKLYYRSFKVKSDGWQMIQSGYDNGPLLVHQKIFVPPPHPVIETALFGLQYLFSTSKPQMSVHSVTTSGNALATTVIACVGININCSEPIGIPAHTLNFGTVKTSPSLGDYAAAVAGYFCDQVVGLLVGQLVPADLAQGIINSVIRFVPDIKLLLPKSVAPFVSPLLDPVGTVQSKVQQAVDGVVSKIKQAVS